MTRAETIEAIDALLEDADEICQRTPGGTFAFDALGKLYDQWGIERLEDASDLQLAEALVAVRSALGVEAPAPGVLN